MKPVATPSAPSAIGPYSQAIVAGEWVFCSGQIAIVPETGRLIEGDIHAETRQVLHNLGAVLAAAGAGPDTVVKTTVFLASMDDFAMMNSVYAEFFGEWRPARATVEVSRLPRGVRVEIDAIARVR